MLQGDNFLRLPDQRAEGLEASITTVQYRGTRLLHVLSCLRAVYGTIGNVACSFCWKMLGGGAGFRPTTQPNLTPTPYKV